MDPSSKDLIYISDEDDELEFIGSSKRSTPNKLAQTNKSLSPFQTSWAKKVDNFSDTRGSFKSPSCGRQKRVPMLNHSYNRSSHPPNQDWETINSLAEWHWDDTRSCETEIGASNSSRVEYRYLTLKGANHGSRSNLQTPSPSKIVGNSSSSESASEKEANPGKSLLIQRKRRRSNSLEGKRSRKAPEAIRSDPDVIDLDGVDEDSGMQNTSCPGGRKATEKELKQTVTPLYGSRKDVLRTLPLTAAEHLVIDLDGDENDAIEAPRHKTGNYLVIDLGEEDDFIFMEELRILQPPQSSPGKRKSAIFQPRNLSLNSQWSSLQSISRAENLLQPGMFVELEDNGFLHIKTIWENIVSKKVVLRGYRLLRSKDLNGTLHKKLNELCWTADIVSHDKRPYAEQAIEEINLENVVKERKVNITNKQFPEGSFRDCGNYESASQVVSKAPCTARWRYTCRYLTYEGRENNHWYEKSLEHLHQKDLSPDLANCFQRTDAQVRFQFRGKTPLGGAYRAPTESNDDTDEIDLTQEDKIGLQQKEIRSIRHSLFIINLGETDRSATASNQLARHPPSPSPNGLPYRARQASKIPRSIDVSRSDLGRPPDVGLVRESTIPRSNLASRNKSIRPPGQKYTYGDSFCGAGGTTRGAVMAGLEPIWGFDYNNHACTSWRLNFPEARMYEMWADEFIQLGMGNDSLKTDIVHLSPPCQFFSPAHTVLGKNDEMNSASLFACGHILEVAKPRIVTLEQTFGIVLLPRFRAFFNALVLMFTERGFSVRWKVALLQDWGLPQRRQRLIMIAACPGEVLPEFPPFTHSDPKNNKDGLKPWVTVNSVLNSIPLGTPNHDLEAAEARELYLTPWSGDSIAPRCITTHGGQNYHPSGKRGFTNREYAALQGFPHAHLFGNSEVKKQIGNAVPPSIAKVLFEWIRKCLEEADGFESNHFEID